MTRTVQDLNVIDGAFAIAWVVDSHRAQFRAHRAMGSDGATALFAAADAVNSWETTTDITKADVCMEGHVKWDGCVQFHVGTPGVPWHTCQPLGWARHLALQRYIYRRAGELLGRWTSADLPEDLRS